MSRKSRSVVVPWSPGLRVILKKVWDIDPDKPATLTPIGASEWRLTVPGLPLTFSVHETQNRCLARADTEVRFAFQQREREATRRADHFRVAVKEASERLAAEEKEVAMCQRAAEAAKAAEQKAEEV